MAKKKPCGCKDKVENNLYRAYIAYQSSNEMTPGQMHCWKEFIAGLEKEGVLPYVVFQVGTPPCIQRPGDPPCPKP